MAPVSSGKRVTFQWSSGYDARLQNDATRVRVPTGLPIKEHMTFDSTDVNNLALVTWKEARGEGPVGCRAVMHVIFNRVGTPGFAHTLHDVIYGKNQFTSMSVSSDPEFNLTPADNDVIYKACQNLAQSVLSGSDTDCTNGAHYYANLKNTTSGWFFTHIVNDTVNHPVTATIGHHTFFK